MGMVIEINLATGEQSTREEETPVHQPTDSELLAKAKADREAAVSAIVVTVNGKTFDGDEVAQGRMARAALAMNESDALPWVLADNSVATVTKAELIEALRLAGAEMAAIWVSIYK